MLRISPEVQDALAEGRPVVALESTLVAHGLPSPKNLETAREAEEVLRARGVVPATCAVLDGVLRVGLSGEELLRLTEPGVAKAGERDLAGLIAQKRSGATTVSATLALAKRAKIRFFATGGIGGVHRGLPLDISADLYALARAKVAVVASGAKSVLDIPATLEALEALCVPVAGIGTNTFPRFYVQSGPPLEMRVDSPEEAAALVHAHFDLLQSDSGVLLANPSPLTVDEAIHENAVHEALSRARRENVQGKAVTPFLLQTMREILGDVALEANTRLIVSNAAMAGEIARAYAALR